MSGTNTVSRSTRGVTLTANQLNALATEADLLDGLTATAAELNALDITGAGTAQASKAVVLDGSKGIATITSATITTLTSTTVNSAALTGTNTLTMTSANAAALAVGLAGATNPAFQVDSSTGSQAAGLKVTGAATGGTVALAAIDSGAAANVTINAKGTGTIGIGSVSTGAVTITPATTVTGALTLTAGIVGGIPRNAGTWCNNTATAGTDTACTNGTAYVGSVFLGANATITGIQFLVGSVGGTDSVVASLHDSAGTLLANSALAGAVVGTAAQVQQVALTATYAAKGPAWYFVALTFNGATAKFRSVPAYCNAGSGVVGNGVAQTFGTAATFTAPTTFTADKVPVASLY